MFENRSSSFFFVVILIISIVITLIVFALVQIQLQEKEEINDAKKLLEDAIELQKTKDTMYFLERIHDIRVVSELPIFKRNIHSLFTEKNNNSEVTELMKTLTNIQQTYGYRSIWIVDNEFNVKFISTDDISSKVDRFPHRMEHIEEMSEGIFFEHVHVYPPQRIEVFTSKPIIQGEKVIGFLVLNNDISEHFNNNKFENITTETGEVIIVQEIHEHIQYVTTPRYADNIPTKDPILQDDIFSYSASNAVKGKAGNIITEDHRGEEVLIAWDYSPLTNWGIMTKIDMSEIRENSFATITNISIFTATLILIISTITILLNYHFNKNTKKIINVAQQISNKNFDVKLPITGTKNDRAIASAFNTMTNAINEEMKAKKAHIKELQETEIQKAQFAAMASHELKTPLVPIKGYLEMLLEPGLIGKLSSEQKELLENIYEGTITLEKLIKRILTVERLDVGQIKWNISEFDVVDLMDSIYRDNLIMCKKKNITFSNKSEPATIKSDYERIKEVFSNLIQNAVDFVPENGVIEIGAKKEGEFVKFYCKDNGAGISKEDQKGLFKKFYQVDTSLRRKHGGAGLGLAICKGIVEGLGGIIWVNSDKGKGTTFFFTVPIANKLREIKTKK